MNLSPNLIDKICSDDIVTKNYLEFRGVSGKCEAITVILQSKGQPLQGQIAFNKETLSEGSKRGTDQNENPLAIINIELPPFENKTKPSDANLGMY